ncbi:MAG TPA: hypothetical protein VMI06_11565 [Terriglobia bacterium]|nr:hypothetical protein [Terriglobia bacterium]
MPYQTPELAEHVTWVLENSTNLRLEARRSHDRCEQELQALRSRMAEVRNRTLGNLPDKLCDYPVASERNKEARPSVNLARRRHQAGFRFA